MAKKNAVVRAGQTLHVGVKDGEKVVTEVYSPGDSVSLDSDEVDRLMDAGVLVKPKSEEAEVARAAADLIPRDFPGRDALAKEGVDTFTALAAVEDLTAIEGVGEKTAKVISDALKARGK